MNKSIKLNEKLECKGYWWLPSKPENKIAGILTYTPNEKIKLELIGRKIDENVEKSPNPKNHYVFWDCKKIR